MYNVTNEDIPGFPKHRSLKFSSSKEADARSRVQGKSYSTGPCGPKGSVKHKVKLTEDFYSNYTCWDRIEPHMGPEEFLDFTRPGNQGRNLAAVSNLLCPWTSTLKPLNEHWAKGLSIVKDKIEYVCRTAATRHKHNSMITRSTRLYKCEICKNIQIPNNTVLVYCYIYHEDAPEETRELWKQTFLRICFVHFVQHGINLKRPFSFEYDFKQKTKNLSCEL